MWRVKSSNAEISECDKQKEIKEPIVGNLANSEGDIVIVQECSMVDDHDPNLGIPNILNLSGVLPA